MINNALQMTKRWVRIAVCAACCALLLSACRKEQEGESSHRETSKGAEQTIQIPMDHVQPGVPEDALVLEQFAPLLADFPTVRPVELKMDAREKDGIVQIAARLLLRVQEDLYESEEVPKIFEEDRKQINRAMNQAMLPDAHFLLQVGATTEMLTEADRAIKPLPPELQGMADAMQELAQRPLYRLRTPANTTVEIPATVCAVEKDGKWCFRDISLDTASLRSFQSLVASPALPRGATLYAPGFEARVRAELREKMAAFDQAARQYVGSREQAARETLIRMQAAHEESEKSAQEKEQARAAWEKSCADLLYDTALYEGEWKRADSFGKFSLRVSRGKVFPEAFQFVGALSDTDLPQVELHVTGRAELAKHGEAIPCVVRIFDGRYDPDVPTAEVFDAKDALMRLSLMPDGSLSGVLTCESWGEKEADRVFQVQLHLVPSKDQSGQHEGEK